MKMVDAMQSRLMDVWGRRVPDPGALAVWIMGTDAAARFHAELVADAVILLDPTAKVEVFMGIPVVVDDSKEGWSLADPAQKEE